MARRSTSQFRIDDRAYPIRVKVYVPSGGMRSLDSEPEVWLRDNLDHLAWAWGPAPGIGDQVTAYHFRRLDDAQRFVAAFPHLRLADAVDSIVYRAPAKDAGPGPHGDGAHRIGHGWKGNS